MPNFSRGAQHAFVLIDHRVWPGFKRSLVQAWVVLLLLSGVGVVPAAHAAEPHRIAMGPSHRLVIRADGSLWAWGDNRYGQLGFAQPDLVASPVQIGTGYVQVSTSQSHTVALKGDGSLWAWGNNAFGQLGVGTRTDSRRPVQVGEGYVQVVAADTGSLALKADGSVWAWGRNEEGQLGDGTLLDALSPVQMGSGFIQISRAQKYSVGLKADGSVWGWGRPNFYSDSLALPPTVPTRVGDGFAQIAAGDSYGLAAKPDGSLWAWGAVCPVGAQNGCVVVSTFSAPFVATPVPVNLKVQRLFANATPVAMDMDGRLLNLTRDFSKPSVPVVSGDFVSLAMKPTGFTDADSDAIGIKGDDSVWVRGTNGLGALGQGQSPYLDAARLVGSGYVQVAAGASHSLALAADGVVWGWGSNVHGQLGSHATVTQDAPLAIDTGFARIFAFNLESAGIKRDGSLWLWGRNSYLQGNSPYPPTQQAGGGYVDVALAYDRHFAVQQDGSLWAWGLNAQGQLADGTTQDRPTPVKIGEGYVRVVASNEHSLALKADGSLWGWWARGAGVPVRIGAGFAAIGASSDNLFALDTQGRLVEIRNLALVGAPIDGSTLVAAPGLTWLGQGFAGIGTAFGKTGVIDHAGALWPAEAIGTHGIKAEGSKGRNVGTPSLGEQAVGVTFLQSAAGQGFDLRLMSDGTVWAQGDNQWGQAGESLAALESKAFLPVSFAKDAKPPTVAGQMNSIVTGQGITTLGASITPRQEHLEAPGHIFFIAVLPDGRVFTHTPRGWLPLHPTLREAHSSLLLATQVALLIGVDTAAMTGAAIYMGYGLGANASVSWEEMLAAGRYKIGHVLR